MRNIERLALLERFILNGRFGLHALLTWMARPRSAGRGRFQRAGSARGPSASNYRLWAACRQRQPPSTIDRRWSLTPEESAPPTPRAPTKAPSSRDTVL